MSDWLNHVSIAAPQNGGTTHVCDPSNATGGGTVVDGTAFTPTVGRMLVVFCYGAVTFTTPAGWTLPTNGSAVNVGGLYVFYKASAAGSDTFTTTQNGTNYQVCFDVYEFNSGSAFVKAATGTSLASVTPTLSALDGTAHWIACVLGNNAGSTGSSATAATWSTGTRTAFIARGAPGGTDGYNYTTAEFNADSSTSKSASATITGVNGTCEGLTVAFTVAAPPVDTGYIVQEDGTSKILLETGTGDAIIGEHFTSTSLTRSESDTAAATDAVVRTVSLVRGTAETAGATDVDARTSARSRAQADSAPATDADVPKISRGRAAADAAPATDTTARGSLAFSRSAADSAPAVDTDANSVAHGTISRSTSDTAAATDVTSRAVALPRSAADSAPATDAGARSSTRSRASADTAPATDTAARALTVPRSTSDTAPATDTTTRTSTRSRAVSDSAPATDTTSASSANNQARSTTDSAPATDVTARSAAARARATLDTAAASDLAARAEALSRQLLDNALAADTTVVVTAGGSGITILSVVEYQRPFIAIEHQLEVVVVEYQRPFTFSQEEPLQLAPEGVEFYAVAITTDPVVAADQWQASFDGGDGWHAAQVVDGRSAWLVAGYAAADPGAAVAILTSSMRPLVRHTDDPNVYVRYPPTITLH